MKGKNQDPQVKAGWVRKATICNIWINLGKPNPFTGEHVDETARRIAQELGIETSAGRKGLPDEVIAWVRTNRPRLLQTAAQRQLRRK